MSDGLQSELLRDPGRVLEDLKLIAAQRSRIPDEVLDDLAQRAAEVSKDIEPGTRKWDRLARFFARERKLEIDGKRLEVDIHRLILTATMPQVVQALQVNIDTQRASEKDEALNDLVARTAVETRALLDSLNEGPIDDHEPEGSSQISDGSSGGNGHQPRPDSGDPGREPPDSHGPGGNGNGRPEKPA